MKDNPFKRPSSHDSGDRHNRSESRKDKKKSKKHHHRVSHTCDHLEEFKARGDGINIYSKIHSNFVCNSHCNEPARKEVLKSTLARCTYCGKFDGFVNACLHCVTFGCIIEGHMTQHYKETNHPLVCYLNNGSIYCFKCVDFVFDRQLDIIATRNEELLALEHRIPYSRELFPNYLRNKANLFSRRLRKYANSSSSSAGDGPSGSKGPPIPKPQCITTQAIWGLRGLINLGQTCFLNAIVQALIHTPMLRDFFLTEQVDCDVNHGSEKEKPCIAPLFSTLFQDFYNGSKSPMSLHDLLYKMWVNAEHVSGYDQQDAHEFFMAMILALHEHFKSEKGKNNIIDLLFLGNLESSVTCQVCGRISVTVDPIWDASLNLLTDSQNAIADGMSQKSIAALASQEADNAISLDECLQRYCQEEYLLGSESIFCSSCSRNQDATKQLKFRDVPIIFLIHLKRFKHRGQSEKVNNPVKFPEHLDMTPYTPGFVSQPERVPGFIEESFVRNSKKSENRYVLYGVVNHQGSYEGGHYYAYIRNARNDWYLCDDSNISTVTLETVLNSPGYLLFYHRESVLFDSPVMKEKEANAKHR